LVQAHPLFQTQLIRPLLPQDLSFLSFILHLFLPLLSLHLFLPLRLFLPLPLLLFLLYLFLILFLTRK
jgi:hypothetical protein